jgi:hypothetical protein
VSGLLVLRPILMCGVAVGGPWCVAVARPLPELEVTVLSTLIADLWAHLKRQPVMLESVGGGSGYQVRPRPSGRWGREGPMGMVVMTVRRMMIAMMT